GLPLRLPLFGSAVASVLAALLRLGPASASSAVVPDQFQTVQLAVDSGADTVLIRDGDYPERVVVDHAVALQGIGSGRRPRLQGLDVFNTNFWAVPPLLSVSQIDFSAPVHHTTLYYRPRLLELRFAACSLDSGFLQIAYLDTRDIWSLVFCDCHMAAHSTARAEGVFMRRDILEGSVSWGPDGDSTST